MSRNHYHIVWDNGFGQELGEYISNKRQAKVAAKNQALRYGRTVQVEAFYDEDEGAWIVENPIGPDTLISYQRCSQQPCSVAHPDSPYLDPIPLP